MGWEHGSTLGMAGITRRRPSLDGTAPEASLPMAKPPMASAPMGSEGGPPESGNWEQVSLLDLAAAVAIAPTALPIPTAAAVSTATGSDPQTAAAAERPAGVAAACPTHLLILDTETTGLDPEQDHCIEVGAILFHVPSRAVLSQVSFLLPCESNPAEPINGISAAVSRLIQPWQAGLAYFRQLVEAADVIVAHNASFDRQAQATEAWRCFRAARNTAGAAALLPVLRLGHSLGCKLHVLAPDGGRGCRGLAAMSFNNFSADRSIPLLADLAPRLGLRTEFSPSPEETLRLVGLHYRQPRNLLIRFGTDALDQSRRLIGVLQQRPDDASTLLERPGDHLTPASAGLRQNLLGAWADDPARQRQIDRLADQLSGWWLGPASQDARN